jgi:methanogenic corrinoid protein MtbC1
VTQDPGAPDLPPLPRVDPRAEVRPDAITPEVLAGFLADGDEGVVRWALRLALDARPRADVYDDLVRPAMGIVGERWSNGRWTISEEHLASQTLLRVLAALGPEERDSDRVGPLCILAGAEGEEHGIALVLLQHVLREAGWAVANLGPNVPVDDLVRFVTKVEPRMVALTASHPDRLPALERSIERLHALPFPVAVLVGGRIVAGTSIPTADGTADSLRGVVGHLDGLLTAGADRT